MGTIRRFKDIVNSNLNSILDKAEDPEKMIKMMIQEMDDNLIELKRSCSDKVAQKVQITRELEVLTAKVDQWQQRAEMAISKDKEELAKEAIQMKQKLIQEKTYRVKDVDHLVAIIKETTNQIATVESKLDEVQQKYRLLIQRGIHAVEKKHVSKIIKDATGTSVLIRFDQLENRIEKMEAEAELSGQASVGSFDKEFTDLEQEAKVNEELAALKSQMKTKPAAKSPASKSAEVKEA